MRIEESLFATACTRPGCTRKYMQELPLNMAHTYLINEGCIKYINYQCSICIPLYMSNDKHTHTHTQTLQCITYIPSSFFEVCNFIKAVGFLESSFLDFFAGSPMIVMSRPTSSFNYRRSFDTSDYLIYNWLI